MTKNEHFLKLCLEGQLGPRRAALAKLNKTPRIRRGPGKGGQDVFVNSPFCEYLSETAKRKSNEQKRQNQEDVFSEPTVPRTIGKFIMYSNVTVGVCSGQFIVSNHRTSFNIFFISSS